MPFHTKNAGLSVLSLPIGRTNPLIYYQFDYRLRDVKWEFTFFCKFVRKEK